jgi:hypothetical protein
MSSDPAPEDLEALLDRGSTLVLQSDLETAVTVYEEAVALCRALVEDTVLARSELPRVIAMLAMSLSMSGESAEAVRVGREAYELTGNLYGRDPDCTLLDVARIAVNFGRWLAADGHDDEALECAYYGLQHLDDLTPSDPLTYLGWRVALLKAVAEVVPEGDDPYLAITDVRRDLVATCRRLAELAPGERRHRRDLAEALVLLARALADEDDEDDEPAAIALAREAVSIQRAEVSPPSGVNALARALAALGDLLSDEGRDADAEVEIAQAAEALVEPWNARLTALVLVWEWVLAPTFWLEQGVLEFNHELLEPEADDVVAFALTELTPSEAGRLRALRAASRELGVAEAYQRRAEDPLGFLVAYA